jgi:hypothetical protein
VSAATLGVKGCTLEAKDIIPEGHIIKFISKNVSISWLILWSSFSYKWNWHGRGDYRETLVPKFIPRSTPSGKGK